MKHKAKLTISRPTWGSGKKAIALTVEDEDAGIQFLEIEIWLEEFAEALTGLAYRPCMMEVRGLDKVGMQEELIHPFKFELPEEAGFRDKKVAKLELEKICPEGWTASSYFNSQSSFFTEDGKSFAQTTLRRWVNKADSQTDND